MLKKIPLLVAPFLFLSCGGVQLQKSGMTDPGELLFNGHTDPAVNCYSCHNGDARGASFYPSLAEAAVNMPDDVILTKIEKGGSWMPAYGDKTSLEQRQQIVGWLRTTFGGKAGATPATVDEVEEVEEVEEVGTGGEPATAEPAAAEPGPTEGATDDGGTPPAPAPEAAPTPAEPAPEAP